MTLGEQVKTAATDLKVIVASILALIYLLALLFLLSQFGLGGWPIGMVITDGNYDRSVALFNALSGIGAAAVGVLLGTKIEKVKVENAEKKKEKAEGALRGLAAAANDVLPAVGSSTLEATLTDKGGRTARERLLQAIARADEVLGDRAST
jgi:hypothetical protein